MLAFPPPSLWWRCCPPSSLGAVLLWLVLMSHLPLVWCGAVFPLLGGVAFSSSFFKVRVRVREDVEAEVEVEVEEKG